MSEATPLTTFAMPNTVVPLWNVTTPAGPAEDWVFVTVALKVTGCPYTAVAVDTVTLEVAVAAGVMVSAPGVVPAE